MYNTEEFIEKLQEKINENITCYYEKAPEDESGQYAVLSNIDITTMDPEDLAYFDIDLWNKESFNNQDNAIDIEKNCDNLRNILSKATIISKGKFIAHIYTEKRQNENENEFDLIHRKLTFSAKIYNL